VAKTLITTRNHPAHKPGTKLAPVHPAWLLLAGLGGLVAGLAAIKGLDQCLAGFVNVL
jgi:hypothetical protein